MTAREVIAKGPANISGPPDSSTISTALHRSFMQAIVPLCGSFRYANHRSSMQAIAMPRAWVALRQASGDRE
jgi:hypothetical protein